jgi:hypothetical protein
MKNRPDAYVTISTIEAPIDTASVRTSVASGVNENRAGNSSAPTAITRDAA